MIQIFKELFDGCSLLLAWVAVIALVVAFWYFIISLFIH